MSNEIKIGVTVVLAVLAAYAGFRFMSDAPIFGQTQEIVSFFERVDGLTEGSVVYLNGVKIGSVRSVELRPDNRVGVSMSIDRHVSIPVDSEARLTSTGLLDAKAIVIERGRSGEYVDHGGEIEGVYVDTLMETLGARGEELGDEVSESLNELNRFLMQLNRTLDDENRQSLGNTIQNLETTTSAVSQLLVSRQKDLEESISAIQRLVAQLDTMATDNRPRVDSLMEDLEDSAGEFKKVSRELDVTVGQVNQILFKINDGEGTFGRMVNDPSLYNNADSLSVELKNLIRGINENPGRYLRHMSLIEIF